MDSWLLPGHSSIQLQIIDVILDPGLIGISTDLPASLGYEDDTWLRALAAGLVIVSYVCTWNLLGGIGEAAGCRRVSTNCKRRGQSELSHHLEGRARQKLLLHRMRMIGLLQAEAWVGSLVGIWAFLPRNIYLHLHFCLCFLSKFTVDSCLSLCDSAVYSLAYLSSGNFISFKKSCPSKKKVRASFLEITKAQNSS